MQDFLQSHITVISSQLSGLTIELVPTITIIFHGCFRIDHWTGANNHYYCSWLFHDWPFYWHQQSPLFFMTVSGLTIVLAPTITVHSWLPWPCLCGVVFMAFIWPWPLSAHPSWSMIGSFYQMTVDFCTKIFSEFDFVHLHQSVIVRVCEYLCVLCEHVHEHVCGAYVCVCVCACRCVC